MDTRKQELCTIRIMFPVESDEQALEYKKKITALFSDMPNAHTHFEIMTSPPQRPPRIPT